MRWRVFGSSLPHKVICYVSWGSTYEVGCIVDASKSCDSAIIIENCDGSIGACDPCFPWKNHGEFVRCVAHEVEALVTAGLITEEEGDALVSSAAQSDIGKKWYTPPECGSE